MFQQLEEDIQYAKNILDAYYRLVNLTDKIAYMGCYNIEMKKDKTFGEFEEELLLTIDKENNR